ncbi:MAG: YerC/YecD family TrpR-related protein [Oscillospiraceae bacterium]|nr:YerC/YecD family TrpR-related protein [Oscillospiraceae bacterium]
MNDNIRSSSVEFLFRAVLSLESMEECFDFFEDLCTFSELKACSQRYQVAELLDEGRVYNEIVRQTGASTATISRVNRTLNYGNDGYKVVFERLAESGESCNIADGEIAK